MKILNVRKLLVQIHFYSGLFFLPYLIIFGLSTLHINHHFALFEENKEWTNESSQTIHFEYTEDNQLLAENIRDSLQLIGWCPWWTQSRKGNEYQFSIESPGSKYRISAMLTSGTVDVKKRGKGFWNIMHSLHFLSEDVPNASAIVNSWQYYQDLTVIYLLFAVFSGIYLFFDVKPVNTTVATALIGGFLISIILMLYIWLVG